MGPKLTSQASEARRLELLLRSTPLQAAQASPEGWEKLPEWLGWMNDSWGQPSPSGCSQGCGRGCRGTAAGRPAGKEEEERELNCVSPKSLESASGKGRPAPKASERVAVEPGSLPRPARSRALPATLLLSTAGFSRRPPGTSRSQRPWAHATLCPGHPVPAHTP